MVADSALHELHHGENWYVRIYQCRQVYKGDFEEGTPCPEWPPPPTDPSRPVWKSNFGRPTPSTRCRPRNPSHRLISTQAGASKHRWRGAAPAAGARRRRRRRLRSYEGRAASGCGADPASGARDDRRATAAHGRGARARRHALVPQLRYFLLVTSRGVLLGAAAVHGVPRRVRGDVARESC